MRTLASTLVLAFITAVGADAAEINALITTAMKPAIDEIGPRFERASGHTLRVTYGPSGALARRLAAGEPADLIILAEPGISQVKNGNRAAAEWTAVARTQVGVCVKKGAPKPDISSPEAVKRMLLAAKTVAFVAPASGGVTGAHLVEMFDKLGIGAEINAKARLAAGGPDGRVSMLVSSGEAEIGLQQISELMSNPGVDVVGTLPPGLAILTVYGGALIAGTKQEDAAKALIRILTAPKAANIYKSKGLEPAP